ncbi:MAG: DsbA family oxidoreductase [Gammaproteobacteria bacterium]
MLIEIFSDVVCPWCYIGKRRLDAVLDGYAPGTFEVRWRAFQLYPMLPEAGMPREAFMRARFGRTDAGGIYARILDEARPLGLDLDFERIAVSPNTRRAHRMLAWASGPRQHALAEALFSAYFREGIDVGDPAALVEVAVSAGFDRASVVESVATGAGDDAVAQDLAQAEQAEVTGVPFYVLAERFAIPGAQPPDVLRQLLDRARTRLATG